MPADATHREGVVSPLLTPLCAPLCTHIVLIRHGETDWNVVRRLQGHTDIPLNATGQQQAQQAAIALADTPLAALYSSDLLRAQATADAIAAPHGLAVQLVPALRERHYGVFEGLCSDAIAAQHPAAFAAWQTRDAMYVIPGGESLSDLYRRVCAAFSQIVAHHAGQTIGLVAHGGVLDCLYRLVNELPLGSPRDFPLRNASLNWVVHMLEQGIGRFQVERWGEVGHLEGIDPTKAALAQDEIDPRVL